MGKTEFSSASSLRGGGRVARGAIVSLIAVFSTAVAHHAVTGHAPGVSTLVLALAITSPVCIALSKVPRSRLCLAGGVFAGQLFLHLLFTPLSSFSAQGHDHQLLVHAEPGPLLIHLAALTVTYAGIRRGDHIVQSLQLLLEMWVLRRLPESVPVATRPARVPPIVVRWLPVDKAPGQGPAPLRGPPALTAA